MVQCDDFCCFFRTFYSVPWNWDSAFVTQGMNWVIPPTPPWGRGFIYKFRMTLSKNAQHYPSASPLLCQTSLSLHNFIDFPHFANRIYLLLFICILFGCHNFFCAFYVWGVLCFINQFSCSLVPSYISHITNLVHELCSAVIYHSKSEFKLTICSKEKGFLMNLKIWKLILIYEIIMASPSLNSHWTKRSRIACN